MTPDRWRKVEELYHAALERDVTLREAFLHEACAGDDALRQEVERLLAAEEKPTGGLESPIQEAAAQIFDESFEEAPAESLIGRQLGFYHVLSKIGEGGMGEVYRALDTKLRRDVALKVLPKLFARDPERLARFRREAQLLASLNHKNIAAIYGLEESDGVHFLVLELVEGETLADRLQRAGPLPAAEALPIAQEIAEALEFAHKKGITHRDVKPANIKLTPEGQIKVLDFGLAKVFVGEEGGVDLSQMPTLTAMGTEEGRILGTPAYMSPEQVRGKEVDRRTDIWAFGCVLYELLSGQRAYRAETISDTLAKVLEREPDWDVLPPKIPAQVRELLERCVQKDKQRRLGEMGEAQRAIEEALFAPRRQRVTRRKALAMAGAALVAVFAVPMGLNVGGVRDRLLGTGLPAPIQSIAVLPLQNLSGDPEQDYFAEGMHDALITDLAKLSGLGKVIARASMIQSRDTDKPLQQIGRELGVDAVITGAVLREGDRVRITAQLINAATGEQLWADRYERQLRDVLSLQNEVVTAITREMQLQLTPQEQTRLASARPVNPEAYEAYLKGRFFLSKLTLEGFEQGLEYLELATELDSSNPVMFANLALGYTHIGHDPAVFKSIPMPLPEPVRQRAGPRSWAGARWRKPSRPMPRPSFTKPGNGRVWTRIFDGSWNSIPAWRNLMFIIRGTLCISDGMRTPLRRCTERWNWIR